MPIFLPFDKLLAGVCVGAEIDDPVVAVELEAVLAAEENSLRSELCHHTGIPSPIIVRLVTVVVYGVLEWVHELTSFW
jgi:hypothetical protein